MELIAVNVGKPASLIDERTGREVLSGIRKQRVSHPTVWVGELNIEGDGQADLENHGGVDKALYTYSLDHIPAWMDEIGYGDGLESPFGENLSIRGQTEDDARIGDRWRWGEVVLEICQPRWPCFKLGLRSGHRDLPARLIASERSGWYARVISTGQAPTTGSLELVHREPDAPTVREAFRAARGKLDRDQALAVAAFPVLASRWRDIILTRYPETVPTS